MSENSKNKNTGNEEIDLLELFRRMGKTLGKWGNSLGRAFLTIIVFLFRRWLPLGLSITLGVGVSYLMRMTSDSSYSADLLLRNNQVSNSEMISYLNQLHVYCKEKNTEALQKSISILPGQAKNIIDISAFWVVDQKRDGIPDYVDYKNNHDVYDTINLRMQDRLDVRVKIKSPQELTIIRNGILAFIEKDSLFQQRNRVRIRLNHELLARLGYDILQLDSLQKIKYFEETKNQHPQSGGQMIFLQEQKTQLVYTDIYTLYARKQALEVERDLYSGIVTVLSEFTIPARRENGTSYYAIRIIPLFFSIVLLTLILLANRKKLEDVFSNY
jgi:hypothetical protein